MPDFKEMIAEERKRLAASRDDAMTRRSKIDEEIIGINQELAAIDAYEQVKNGSRNTTVKRGSHRDNILQLLQKATDGMTRGEVLTALGIKDSKAGAQSVSNALGNLKKAGKVAKRDGKYITAA